MRHIAALAALALLSLSGCSRDEPGEGGVTSEERHQLDNAAAMVDNQTDVDTSADSLVLDEDAANQQAATDSLGNAAANEAAAQ